MSKRTVRLLNLQGGGIRGYLTANVLERFCRDANIDPNKLYQKFDIISGTSIGGIQTLGYAKGLSPTQFKTLIENNAETIFNYGAALPWVQSRSTYALAVLMGLEGYTFEYLGQNISCMYQNTGLNTVLTSALGANTLLSDIPGKVIVTAYDVDESKPVLFSNITGEEPLLIGAEQKAVDVGLATSAAPTYFPIYGFNGHKYIDGGVFQNNPVNTNLSIARKLYPDASRFFILSIGTGMPTAPLVFNTEGYTPYNIQYLNYLSNQVFIPAPQQAVQDLMSLIATNPYEEVFEYQFQYTFKSGQDGTMDNPEASNLTALANYANAQYDIDAYKIASFINHFNID